MLKREISERLYSWKNENKKKALCVIGARQIGKTTIIREFARNEYSCAMKSHFRKFGNQMSGSGNHLCNYASLLA